MTIVPKESLIRAFQYPLLFLQIFGFLPVSGIFQEHPNKIRFNWINFKTIYSILTISGLAFFAFLQFYRFAVGTINIIDVNRSCLTTKSLVGSILLFKLAKKWRRFMGTCFEIDKRLNTYKSVGKFNIRVKAVVIIFGLAFLGDYFLLQAVFINEYLVHNNLTLNFKTWNYVQRVYRFYYVYEFFRYEFISGVLLLVKLGMKKVCSKWVPRFLTMFVTVYSQQRGFLAPVIQLQILVCTALMDALIIVICLVILQKQKQVTKKIKFVATLQSSTIEEWKTLGEDYTRLQRFCKCANKHIGALILLSFTSNLVILLIQLFVSLRSNKSVAETVYLIYTFFYVMFRILSVSLCASEVNEESQKPLRYLYKVPDNVYNIEINRLIHQISRKTMTLSGMSFFSIKRNIVLKIAGSIVTYELVIMQFVGKYSNESMYQNYTLPL